MTRLTRMANILRRLDDSGSPSIAEIAAAFAFVAIIAGMKMQGVFA